MSMSPTAGRWIAFLAASVVTATAASMAWRHLLTGERTSSSKAVTAPASPVVPGDEVFAVDPDIVVEVDFERFGRTTVVRRSPDGRSGGFTISTKENGNAAPSCPAAAALDDLLAQLTSITVTRTIGPDEATDLRRRWDAGAATLRIRDTTPLNSKEFGVLLPDAPANRPVLIVDDALYETSLAREMFDQLSAGCDALGTR
jgi:hypothetical protein